MRLSLNNPECRAKGQIKFRSSIAVCNQIIFDTPDTTAESVDKPKYTKSFSYNRITIVIYIREIFRICFAIQTAMILYLNPVIILIELNRTVGIICPMTNRIH